MAPLTDLPRSPTGNTVRVRMLDTTALMTIKSLSFVEPVQKGHETLNITDVCFLIENEKLGKKVMFDLGVRKDYWNLPGVIQKRLGDVIPSLRVDKDVTEVLEEGGVQLGDIDSIIWSHLHWDHTGNVGLFPHSTSLVVGPGFTTSDKYLPGFPEKADSPVSSSDFKGRELIEISGAKFTSTISSLPAHDFFNDGSLYLLDTPGHCPGHMCALARTATCPDTFIFMGGDICHFAGDFRPNSTHPLPNPIPNGILDKHSHFPSPCPAEVFTSHHPRTNDEQEARTTPWYLISSHEKSAYSDHEAATRSVSRMQCFDESEDVLVCIAHDVCLLGCLPVFNKDREGDLNEWKQKGWKEKCHWGWLNELPRDGKMGRPKIVEGFWRDGKQWDRKAAVTEGRDVGKL